MYLSPDCLHLFIDSVGRGDELIGEELQGGKARYAVRELNKAAIGHHLLHKAWLDHPYLKKKKNRCGVIPIALLSKLIIK